MFTDSHAISVVLERQRREWLAATTRRRLAANADSQGAHPCRRTLAVLAPVRAIASALGRVGALAHDSRESVRTKEQELAALGVTWTTDPAHERELAAELRAVQSRRAASPRFPTLEAIDRALDGARPRYAEAANAARLEQRARELTAQYWSESAWLSGHVPAAAFECVCAALEAERIAAAETATSPVITQLVGEPDLPAAA